MKTEKDLNRIISFCLGILFFLAAVASAQETENGVFSGRVMDVSRNPVAGVEVYVYGHSNIRRPADYISPPSDSTGEFRITLPPGHYWTVARLRKGRERYGPLLQGDKHSGAPLEIDIMPGEQLDEEFVVADLEETSQLTVKFDTSFIKVEGLLQTPDGEPVANGYAYANREEAMKKIPDYVSAWTDSSGRYVLFLPEGTYYFAVARTFPPGPEPVSFQKVLIDSATKNINIVTEK